MKVEKTRSEKLKYAFGANPEQGSFFVTSDDVAFFKKTDANNHAATLENKRVDEVHRAELIKQTHQETVLTEVETETPAVIEEAEKPTAKSKKVN